MSFITIIKNQSRFIRFFNCRKKLTLHDVIILIKSAFNKDKNEYYYSIILQKDSYELHKK